MNQELEDLLNDPNYDQGRLQEWFRQQYGDEWTVMWNRYIETGRFS